MKVELKETKLTDGSKVYDVNIFANSNPQYGHKAIFSCHDEKAGMEFFWGLKKLVAKYTCDRLEQV